MKTANFPPDEGDSARAGQDHHRQPWSSLSSAAGNHIWFGNVPFLSIPGAQGLMSMDRFLLISLQLQMDFVFPGVNPCSEVFLGCSKVPVLLQVCLHLQPGVLGEREIGKVIFFFFFSLLSFAGGGARAASVSHWQFFLELS